MIKELARMWGLNPEEILTREAVVRPHRTVLGSFEFEESQREVLSRALKEAIVKELDLKNRILTRQSDGSPAEIRTPV